MPIVGRTLPEAAQTFCNHLNQLLARTVTQTPLVQFTVRGSPTTCIAFRRAGAAAEVPLQTRYGRVGFYIGQLCGSIPAPKNMRQLITIEYKYMVTPQGAGEPLFRWEYIRQPGAGQGCRHHLQGAPMVYLRDIPAPLNEWHLPTGYVPIEEILRFFIVDLRVRPLSPRWDQVLQDSYRRFRTEFVQA